MREGALKESFGMQREIKRAPLRQKLVQAHQQQQREHELARDFSSAAIERHDLAIESMRVDPAGEPHQFAPQVEDLDRGARGRDRSPPQSKRTDSAAAALAFPLAISTQAAGVPHRSATQRTSFRNLRSAIGSSSISSDGMCTI
jgi:hypothetical protein